MLLKYSYYDHLLAISINRGNFKKAKANIDILKTYKEALERDEVCVIIAKAPCTLIKGKTRKPPVNYIDSNCNGCNKCVSELACPAISKDGGKIAINPSMCDGCGVCIQVCKYGALEAGRGE